RPHAPDWARGRRCSRRLCRLPPAACETALRRPRSNRPPTWRSRSLVRLLLLEQRQVLTIPCGLQLLHRYEAHRRGVHAVALTGRRRTIIKYMSQMRIGMLGSHLVAHHEKFAIALGDDVLRLQRFREGRPDRVRL